VFGINSFVLNGELTPACLLLKIDEIPFDFGATCTTFKLDFGRRLKESGRAFYSVGSGSTMRQPKDKTA
jgi:hypothetical protein